MFSNQFSEGYNWMSTQPFVAHLIKLLASTVGDSSNVAHEPTDELLQH
jgi:hypothetical protein